MPDKLATAVLAKFALAIAVPFHVPEVIVPTDVRLDETTLEASVVPVREPASAVAVIDPLDPRGIDVPFIVIEELTNALFGIPVIFVPDIVGAVTKSIVTAPVAPLTVMFVPAMLDVTPVLVIETAPVAFVFVLKPELVVRDNTPVLENVLPDKDNPVPAVYEPEPEN